MRKKIYLPRSAEELKKLSHQKQAELWARYHNSSYERQFRALWYYIACENANLKIERKHLTKLEKYSENPNECMVCIPAPKSLRPTLASSIRLLSRKLMILFTTDSIIKLCPL